MFGRSGPIEMLMLPVLLVVGPKLILFAYTGAMLARAFYCAPECRFPDIDFRNLVFSPIRRLFSVARGSSLTSSR